MLGSSVGDINRVGALEGIEGAARGSEAGSETRLGSGFGIIDTLNRGFEFHGLPRKPED